MTKRPVINTWKTVWLIVFLFFSQLALILSGRQEQPLQYQLSVNAKIVPFFAVDGKGNPVYDIREDELVLSVNGAPYGIEGFKRFQFEAAEEAGAGETAAVPRKPDRVVFLVLDTVFTSKRGIHRGKEIACELVQTAGPGDRFIVLENAAVGGLKYLIGPEKDTELLIKKIKSIREIPTHRASTSRQPPGLPQLDRENSMFTGDRISDVMRNQADIRRFAHILGQFKYALKTISLPKIVFLISEGVAKKSFQEDFKSGGSVDDSENPEEDIKNTMVFNTFLFSYFKRVARAINAGGSVLYAIDPAPLKDYDDSDESGRMSLMFLAGESGGKYFTGRNTDGVVRQVRKTTAAYYEIFFTFDSKILEKMEIRLECKREGVRLHSLNHAERDREYRNMGAVQKKIFGLNLVTGGEWSRMVGKVVRVKYNKSSKANNAETVTLRMPEKLRGVPVDVFVFYIEPKTQKVDVSFAEVQGNDPLHLTVKKAEGRDRYFAVIEPVNTYCIYNKVE